MKLTDPLTQLDDLENLKKYKASGLLATKTINKILEHAKPNTSLKFLCDIGNDHILKELPNIYPKSQKGISFPLSLSLNEIACSYIPSSSDSLKLSNGDILKIELGIHIDGFTAPICYTTIIGNNINDPIKQNLLKAVTETSKKIMSMMTPSHTNIDIANILSDMAQKYNCHLPISQSTGHIAGEFSHQVSQYILNGHTDDADEFIHSFIMTKAYPKYDFTMRDTPLEENEVYAVDILMSSGPKLSENGKCDIYKRTDKIRMLKLNASKDAINKFKKQPFPISLIDCDTKTKLGLKECISNELLELYPVMACPKGEYVVRVMFTVIVKTEPVILSGKSADKEFEKFV